MVIRCIIPICNQNDIIDKYYCRHSYPDYWELRKAILKEAIEGKIDLIITSNNFFTFFPNHLLDIKKFVENNIVEKLKDLSKKVPLIIGFDVNNSNIKFNPYGGTDAVVCYLRVNSDNMYEYGTHIWECWTSETCNQPGFIEQNDNRVINFKSNKICLLSCGDILSNCHSSGRNLPDADIYISLAHMNFKKWFAKSKRTNDDVSNIQVWLNDPPKKVLVTQQITCNNLQDANYFDEGKYQLIWPPEIRNTQEKTSHNIGGDTVIFVDISF